MQLIKRYHDWPTRLAQYIESCQDKPFEYGQFDCVLFACGGIQAMTGFQPIKQCIGKYKNETGAARYMKKHYGGGVPETLEKISDEVGLKPAEISFAKRGDLVLIPWEGKHAAGVVALDGRSVLAVEQVAGLVEKPVNIITACWSFNR